MLYRVVDSNNQEIGITDNLHYIKKAKNGFYKQCEKDEAFGIVFNNEPFCLRGKNNIDKLEEVVIFEYEFDKYNNKIKKDKSSIDYLSMMTGIDIPD